MIQSDTFQRSIPQCEYYLLVSGESASVSASGELPIEETDKMNLVVG